MTRMMKLVLLLLMATLCPPVEGDEKPRIKMWGTPPQEQPHFTRSAETAPPLPLPVVPQRRNEKKRPPAAPKLIANLENFIFDGWQGSPGSVDTLLRTAQENVKLWYGWEQLDIHAVVKKHTAGVPTRTPIIYLCAYYPLNLTDDQRIALRDYVRSGGTLLINCCGQKDAHASAKEELSKMFERRPLRQLPRDRLIYAANDTIESVKFPASGPADPFALDDVGAEQPPRLEAVTLGTRAAVIVSFEDLACGWNQWDNAGVKRCSPTDSNRLGINIVTCVTAELRFAKYLASTRELRGPEQQLRQQLKIVQLVHDGNWDANPSTVPMLLKELGSNTSVAVDFQPVQFKVRHPELFAHPLLYMTGSWAPQLRKDEVVILRRYLQQGGTLIADAASGRKEFDEAFRKLVAEMLPGSQLNKLPADDEWYRCVHEIDKREANHEPQAVAPTIEAVFLDGRPVILYSPLGLSDGWAHEYSAFARSYTTEAALKLATNLFVYAMQ